MSPVTNKQTDDIWSFNVYNIHPKSPVTFEVPIRPVVLKVWKATQTWVTKRSRMGREDPVRKLRL